MGRPGLTVQADSSLGADICCSQGLMTHQAIYISALVVIGWPEKEKKSSIFDHPQGKDEPSDSSREVKLGMDDQEGQADQEYSGELEQDVGDNGPSGPSGFDHKGAKL